MIGCMGCGAKTYRGEPCTCPPEIEECNSCSGLRNEISSLESRLKRAETIIAVMQRALGVQIFEDAIGTYRIALTGVRRTETHNQSLTDDERKILEES